MASALWKKFFPTREPTSPEAAPTEPAEASAEQDLKVPEEAVNQTPGEDLQPNENAQDGVTQAEAITLTWTKTSLAAAYIL